MIHKTSKIDCFFIIICYIIFLFNRRTYMEQTLTWYCDDEKDDDANGNDDSDSDSDDDDDDSTESD